ncbi:hypothetical protein PybrP1_008665 [[Pythium] brassicae (nom. inval.)]|nr:hypothetical protein PybrP1_008665 [[Pythium] brassicae (nom. inval.)]
MATPPASPAPGSASGALRKRRSTPESAGSQLPSGSSRAVARADSGKPPPAAAAAAPSPLNKFLTRVVVGFAMIGAFALILYGGHLYAWVMVVVLQILLFRELVNVRYRAAAEKNIPWFRSVQWGWFFVALFFNYGDSFGAFIENRKIRFVPPAVVHYLRYHTWISFTMYAVLFVMSVLSLKKGYYKYQMAQYTWTIVILGLIVFQMKYILNNIFNGAWDASKCLFGRKFVKTPFLRLSPNKTWEGFIGAFACTIVFAVFCSAWLAKFQWMICPLESLQLIPDALSCPVRGVFVPTVYTVPASVAKYIGRSQIAYLPIQIHSIWFATFASVVAPFGGFYASAIKRTHNLKDFDSVIPGHGGVMDRMDCQFITALFTSVYYNTFIRSPVPSVAMVVNIVSKLSLDDQHEVLQRIQELLQG